MSLMYLYIRDCSLKSQYIKAIIILLSTLVLFFCQIAYAKYQTEITPAVSIGLLYDDNIDLKRLNKKSDWVATISPSISLNMTSPKNSFLFRYAPTMVRDINNDEDDAIRHSGSFSFGEDITQHLRFDMNDTLLVSDEPIEETEGVYSVRQTRNLYKRSSGGASMGYEFGPENQFNLGYNYSLLKNDDITLDDNVSFDPFIRLTYWFDLKNGIKFDYQHTLANFSRDDNGTPGDDYSGNNAGIRYVYRFNPYSSFLLDYNLSTMAFYGRTNDYKTYDGSVGLSHSFSGDTSLSVSAGYYKSIEDFSRVTDGYSYSVSLDKGFDRGSINLGGNGGWRGSYLETERRGFTKYWGMNADFNYQVTDALSNYSSISYVRDKDETGRGTKTFTVRYGWGWSFLRWYSISIDDTFNTRDDDIITGDYNVNRATVTFTASRPFR
jgi:hypothetical protein